MSQRVAVDWRALYALADHKSKKEGRSFRQLSAHLGLASSGSCFTRIKAGKAVDAEAFVTILNWLGISYRLVLTAKLEAK